MILVSTPKGEGASKVARTDVLVLNTTDVDEPLFCVLYFITCICYCCTIRQHKQWKPAPQHLNTERHTKMDVWDTHTQAHL